MRVLFLTYLSQQLASAEAAIVRDLKADGTPAKRTVGGATLDAHARGYLKGASLVATAATVHSGARLVTSQVAVALKRVLPQAAADDPSSDDDSDDDDEQGERTHSSRIWPTSLMQLCRSRPHL